MRKRASTFSIWKPFSARFLTSMSRLYANAPSKHWMRTAILSTTTRSSTSSCISPWQSSACAATVRKPAAPRMHPARRAPNQTCARTNTTWPTSSQTNCSNALPCPSHLQNETNSHFCSPAGPRPSTYEVETRDSIGRFIDADCLNLVDTLIKNVEAFYFIDLSEGEFFIRFALHIKNLLVRARHHAYAKTRSPKRFMQAVHCSTMQLSRWRESLSNSATY